MVRLLGKIAEKQILATHDTILKHGTVMAGSGGTGTGSTIAIATGFNSVKKGWAVANMKVPPAYNATLGVGSNPVLHNTDGPTVGGTLKFLFSTVIIGYCTFEWFAIGD